MKNLSQYLVLLFIFCCGCYGDSKETVKDGDFEIELLFEKDGCKMYRFTDGGRTIYWSNCSGTVSYDIHLRNKTDHIETTTSK